MQATKGSSGGGGGRTNFLTGYRAGTEGREWNAGPPCRSQPCIRAPTHMHTEPQEDPRVQACGGGAFATKENK